MFEELRRKWQLAQRMSNSRNQSSQGKGNRYQRSVLGMIIPSKCDLNLKDRLDEIVTDENSTETESMETANYATPRSAKPV